MLSAQYRLPLSVTHSITIYGHQSKTKQLLSTTVFSHRILLFSLFHIPFIYRSHSFPFFLGLHCFSFLLLYVLLSFVFLPDCLHPHQSLHFVPSFLISFLQSFTAFRFAYIHYTLKGIVHPKIEIVLYGFLLWNIKRRYFPKCLCDYVQ